MSDVEMCSTEDGCLSFGRDHVSNLTTTIAGEVTEHESFWGLIRLAVCDLLAHAFSQGLGFYYFYLSGKYLQATTKWRKQGETWIHFSLSFILLTFIYTLLYTQK